MKKFSIILIFLLASLGLSAQVYDGITQPTVFRYWMPVNVSVNNPDNVSAAPFVGVKAILADWVSLTPVVQYNINQETTTPQLWLNLNYKQKYYLLMRTVYNLNTGKLSETLSGTAKLGSYMIDFTWYNFFRNDKFLQTDRLQFVAGYASGRIVFNAGYAFRMNPGLVTNLRFKMTKLSWLQLRYDTGTDQLSISTAIHL